MCLPNILFPVFMFAFIFHRRSFSPWWPLAFLTFSPPLWISMFFFLRNSSPLFSVTRSSSFSVIHVSVNIKNNAEKETTLLLFFLSKSPGGHAISFQIKPWVAFGLPYLLIELFYIGMPVVRTDGRSVYGHVITKFSRMGRLPTPSLGTLIATICLTIFKSELYWARVSDSIWHIWSLRLSQGRKATGLQCCNAQDYSSALWSTFPSKR